MSDTRSALLKDLFQSAAELTGEARRRLLADRCAGDDSLRAEIEALLASDERASTRFLVGAGPGPDAAMPERIGRFRLLRRVGLGGMGTVFEAEQDHPRRRVALKVIRTAMLSEPLRRRFDHEVQILGQLKHPGIAQIFEAGAHDDGTGPVPYFAMEYVEGRPVTEFAETNGLTIRDRLSLMAEICDAVHHAHKTGVVHRDLKPANVLVEDLPAPQTSGAAAVTARRGQPKILDFGVARAIHADTQFVTMHTAPGQMVGTLSYMSPEQISGRPDDVDVRSDVYALGVMLYELLARRLPYDLRDRSIPDAGSVICHEEPTRLSAIDVALRGDVETIVAKALAKEPQRRYQSAADLAEDIRRFLRDEPIVARPASRAYQLRKFAKRNKAIVGGVAAVFLVLVAGIAGIGLALHRARGAERLAVQRLEDSRRSAATATAVNGFLQEMLASVDPAKALGKEVTIRQALDEAAARLQSGSLEDQPATEAQLRSTIGTAYVALGHYADAEPHLLAAVELGRRPTDGDHMALVTALTNLAMLRGAQGRHQDEESSLREALALLRESVGEQALETASVMQSLGAALRRQGKLDAAERYYRTALDIRRKRFGDEHIDVAQSLNSLALLYQSRGDYARAESPFREALAMRSKLLPHPHPVVADALNNLANLLHLLGKSEEAATLLREALGMRKSLFAADHPAVAQSLNNLAVVLNDRGDFDGAEPLFHEALAIWRRTLPEGHPDLANCLFGLGWIGNARGAYAEAEPSLREALAIREARLPPGDTDRLLSTAALGRSLLGQQRYAEAEPLLSAACEGMLSQPRMLAVFRRSALQDMIRLYERCDRPDQATPYRDRLDKMPAVD